MHPSGLGGGGVVGMSSGMGSVSPEAAIPEPPEADRAKLFQRSSLHDVSGVHGVFFVHRGQQTPFAPNRTVTALLLGSGPRLRA
jgi:hypothetical protein